MSGSTQSATTSVIRVFRGALFLFFLVLGGCAVGGSGNPFTESTNTDRFVLRVESRNTYEVSVYVNPGGRRQLVGTVPARGLEYFEFDYPAGRTLNVELETQVGDRYRLPAAPIFGGGRLDLMVMGTLRNSGFTNRFPDQEGTAD